MEIGCPRHKVDETFRRNVRKYGLENVTVKCKNEGPTGERKIIFMEHWLNNKSKKQSLIQCVGVAGHNKILKINEDTIQATNGEAKHFLRESRIERKTNSSTVQIKFQIKYSVLTFTTNACRSWFKHTRLPRKQNNGKASSRR